MARLVMTLMTPFTALAPHWVAPGPLITSMRSTSSSMTCCASQKTPENSGEYTVRPSIITSSLLAEVALNPRAVMAYWLVSARATWRLGARRSTSGRLVAPERRISSLEMTKADAATSASRSGRRDTEVTTTLASSSRLSRSRSLISGIADAMTGAAVAANPMANAQRTAARMVSRMMTSPFYVGNAIPGAFKHCRVTGSVAERLQVALMSPGITEMRQYRERRQG